MLLVRPIEAYWSIISKEVYDKSWEADSNDDQLRRPIKKILEVDSFVQRMPGNVGSKVASDV